VPLSVSLPTLVSIDSTSMILKWNKPSSEQLANGILVKNILYVSHMNASITVYVYDCCTTVQLIDNLVPGKQYAIILSACTNGGCTNSSTLEVSTLETLPNVSDLILRVFKKNSTFISIIWNDPTQPNGKIIKYILYMNGIVAFTGNYQLNYLNFFFFRLIL
jgi:usherin